MSSVPDITLLARVADLDDGRTCWVVDWACAGRRGWCLVPGHWGADDVETSLRDLMLLAGESMVRRWLVRPIDLEEKARRWRFLLTRDAGPTAAPVAVAV